MVIEIDLKYIEEMAEEKVQENWRFRTFLKQLDMDTEEYVYEWLKAELWHYDGLDEDDFFDYTWM